MVSLTVCGRSSDISEWRIQEQLLISKLRISLLLMTNSDWMPLRLQECMNFLLKLCCTSLASSPQDLCMIWSICPSSANNGGWSVITIICGRSDSKNYLITVEPLDGSWNAFRIIGINIFSEWVCVYCCCTATRIFNSFSFFEIVNSSVYMWGGLGGVEDPPLDWWVTDEEVELYGVDRDSFMKSACPPSSDRYWHLLPVELTTLRNKGKSTHLLHTPSPASPWQQIIANLLAPCRSHRSWWHQFLAIRSDY